MHILPEIIDFGILSFSSVVSNSFISSISNHSFISLKPDFYLSD